MFLTLLPKHFPDMQLLDVAQIARRARDPDGDLQAVWGGRLPGKRVFGMPAGRHALWGFLDVAGISPGGEVIVAGYNYYVIVRLLIQWGLHPVFADIDPATLTLDAGAVSKAITARTVLVVVTHMFGVPADMDGILDICRPHGIKVFEDCAHAIGTSGRAGQVGTRGDGALFSFGPQKILNCFGGGMLALDPVLARCWSPMQHPNVSLAVAASMPVKVVVSLCLSPSLYRWTLRPLIAMGRVLAAWGRPWLRDLTSPARDIEDYRFDVRSRPAFAAFVPFLCVRQLARLERNIAARRCIVARIKAATADLPVYRYLDEDRFGRSNASYFGVYVDDAAAFTRYMLAEGIEVEPHEFHDCAGLPQFAAYAAACRFSREAGQHLVRLPSFPRLAGRWERRIICAMRRYAQRATMAVAQC